MKRLLPVTGLVALACLVGCARRDRTARPEPPMLRTPGAVTWKLHTGEVFVFEHPENWEIQTPAGQDPGLRTVRLHSQSGLYGQFTLLQDPPATGALAARVIEQIQREEEGLQAEPFTARLAGVEAQGHRFSFKKKGLPWTGWVLSWRRGNQELCALGRWPALAVDLQTQWSSLTENMRLRTDGGPGKP